MDINRLQSINKLTNTHHIYLSFSTLHSLRTSRVFTMWDCRSDDVTKLSFAFVAYTSRVYDVRSSRWCGQVLFCIRCVHFACLRCEVAAAMMRPNFLLHSLRTPRVFTMWDRRSDDAARLSFAFVAYTSRVYDVRPEIHAASDTAQKKQFSVSVSLSTYMYLYIAIYTCCAAALHPWWGSAGIRLFSRFCWFI